MACPASLNAGEDWKMGDKNKTSQAYPHKIHKAGACMGKKKKKIWHMLAAEGTVLPNTTPHAMDLGNGDTYPTRELA